MDLALVIKDGASIRIFQAEFINKKVTTWILFDLNQISFCSLGGIDDPGVQLNDK